MRGQAAWLPGNAQGEGWEAGTLPGQNSQTSPLDSWRPEPVGERQNGPWLQSEGDFSTESALIGLCCDARVCGQSNSPCLPLSSWNWKSGGGGWPAAGGLGSGAWGHLRLRLQLKRQMSDLSLPGTANETCFGSRAACLGEQGTQGSQGNHP